MGGGPSLPSGLEKKKSNVSLKQELVVPLFLIEIIGSCWKLADMERKMLYISSDLNVLMTRVQSLF